MSKAHRKRQREGESGNPALRHSPHRKVILETLVQLKKLPDEMDGISMEAWRWGIYGAARMKVIDAKVEGAEPEALNLGLAGSFPADAVLSAVEEYNRLNPTEAPDGPQEWQSALEAGLRRNIVELFLRSSGGKGATTSKEKTWMEAYLRSLEHRTLEDFAAITANINGIPMLALLIQPANATAEVFRIALDSGTALLTRE